MTMQTITVELPESLYRFAAQLAKATNRPVAEIVQESLNHTLPPLDDVPAEEAAELAGLSLLDDAALWQVACAELPVDQQMEMHKLLESQGAGTISAVDKEQLKSLMDLYGSALVRKSHVRLLLARRGYHVPAQINSMAGWHPPKN